MAILTGVRWFWFVFWFCILICISLIIRDVEHFFHEHTSQFLPQNLLPLTRTRNANHVFFLLSRGRTPLPDHSRLGQEWTPDSSWPKLNLSRKSGSIESRLLTARVLDWEVMGGAHCSRESWSVGSGNADQTAGETVGLRKREGLGFCFLSRAWFCLHL